MSVVLSNCFVSLCCWNLGCIVMFVICGLWVWGFVVEGICGKNISFIVLVFWLFILVIYVMYLLDVSILVNYVC